MSLGDVCLDFNQVKIEFDNKQPVYLQIVKYFKVQIQLGRLDSGDEIPSRRVLAALLNVNPATVQKSYKHMEEEGIIETMQNSKSIIRLDSASRERVKKELTEGEVRAFLKTVKEIKLSFKDVIDLLSDLWDKE